MGSILKEIKRNNVSCAFSLVFIGHWTKLFTLPSYIEMHSRLMNFIIEANTTNPDQTAPNGAV